ncbi:thioredoxin domain-containing protein 15 [Tachyglossus aculeatus]|uniref:thioredoxin domain-containing protein 15 n=1 Tax=Tachyglossus aculeatus TaxID=9261 RepID=UPI0018F5765F|nr:thioredoxin domain-containing protein 15 [Tachyglossus aculeatus]
MGPFGFQLLLWALCPAIRGPVDEDEISLSEQQKPTKPPAYSSGDERPRETVQYKMAEIADAMMGSEANRDHLELLSLLPGEASDRPISELRAGACEAGVQSSECDSKENLFSLSKSRTDVPEKGEGYNLALVHAGPSPAEEANGTESLKTPKVNCDERDVTGMENPTLQILNISQDLMEFLNPNGSDCTLVLFYTPWCRFSANLAPHFNSLPRVFPALYFLALDASQHSSLSTRFGTVAVPNILLFHGAKPMARFNHTDRTLETLKAFIFNQTGIEAKNDVVVTEDDLIGPLPSTLTKSVDWLLVFSLLFLVSFIMYATVRTESIRWLIPGQEQEHQE